MPAHPSQVEAQKKKIEITAVIDFCASKGLNISKPQVFRFFGVPQPTAWGWGFSNSYTPKHRGTGRPEVTETTISPAPREQSPPVKRQLPVRNGGRDRKKLKLMIDSMASEANSDESAAPSTPALSRASSSPAPDEPLSASKRKIAQPGKKHGSRSRGPAKQEADVAIKSEIFDENDEV